MAGGSCRVVSADTPVQKPDQPADLQFELRKAVVVDHSEIGAFKLRIGRKLPGFAQPDFVLRKFALFAQPRVPDFRRGPDRGHPVEFIPVAGVIQARKLKRAVLSGPPAVGNQPVEFPRQLRIERAGQELELRPVREDDRPRRRRSTAPSGVSTSRPQRAANCRASGPSGSA